MDKDNEKGKFIKMKIVLNRHILILILCYLETEKKKVNEEEDTTLSKEPIGTDKPETGVTKIIIDDEKGKFTKMKTVLNRYVLILILLLLRNREQES